MTIPWKPHDFKVIDGSTKVNESLVMVRQWHCKICDSIVEFDIRLTEHEVNRIMTSGLRCIPVEPALQGNGKSKPKELKL